jgi:hypothetical protein
MKRFIGVAAIAFAAHSGWALAQPVIIGPADEPPRGRAERPTPGDAGPLRAPGRSEREAQEQRPDGPARTQRGTQGEPADLRARDLQREQNQQREQAQRERQDEQIRRTGPEQRPDTRPSTPQSAQPQRPDGSARTQRGMQGEPSDMRDPRRELSQREQSQREQAQRERQDEQNRRTGPEQQRPDTRPSTPQSAQPQRPESRPSASDTARPGASPAPDETQRPGSTAQRPDATQPGATETAPMGGRTSAGRQSAEGEQAEPEKRRIADTVRERVERNEIRPVDNLGVSVSVGAELPSRVQLQPVPSEIASIRPQYRDYRYTVSEREIVIVDPRSRRIVEVIERDGGRSGGRDVYAIFEQRRDLRRWRRPDSVVFEHGVVLPPSAPYYDLPIEVVERNPHWRGYQYVMTERDEVAIVEPRTRRIVEVVDKNAAQSASTGRDAPATIGSTARQPMSTSAGDRHEIVRIILKDARPGDITGIEALKGAVLPPEVVMRPVPPEASQLDSQLRGYDYTLLGDDVVIVDPKSREVIDVIE